MKKPMLGLTSSSFVSPGENLDEYVWNFLPLECKGKGVSLVRGGQNSSWANGSLCLIGNAQGMS